jgi:CheY-like chemotaxis protein
MNLGRPALIMMVDDTPANLSVLSDLLSARGFKISAAEDGESALEQLQYVQPDLILLDETVSDRNRKAHRECDRNACG